MISKHKKLILRQHPDFFNQAEKYYTDLFMIFFLRQPVMERVSQLAVVVPKKKLKLRVKRNQLKRLAYQVVSDLLEQYPGFKLVLIPRKKMLQAKLSDVELELKKTLRKITK